MTHATQAYPFEGKVFEFAGNLSKSLTGSNSTFIMIFNEVGAVQTIIFKRPSASSSDLTKQLEETEQSYFFYDPFDAPKHTWISWFKMKRSTLERMVGNRFEKSDFGKSDTASEWTPALQATNAFPETWGVMF